MSPSKTAFVDFTIMTNLRELEPKTMFGGVILVENTVKYLEVHLNTKLTWNMHIKQTINKAQKVLLASRLMFS